MERHSIGRALLGLALFVGLASAAHAGAFVVNPARVTLSASAPSSAITVRNEGTEPTVVQLEASAWTQKAGVDVLGKTQEILATPQSFTIPPGGSQVVRVGLRRVPDAGAEVTYRLFLQEVTTTRRVAQGAHGALRVSLPVFVLPQTSLAPKLEWRATKREDGRLRLQATNAGAAHIEIAEVALSSLYDNKAVGGQKLAAYVLPDNSRQWMLRTDASLAVGAMLRVIAQTDAGDIRADIVLESDSAMAPAQPVVASTAPRQ